MDNILAPLLKQSKRFHPGLVAPNYRASCAVFAIRKNNGMSEVDKKKAKITDEHLMFSRMSVARPTTSDTTTTTLRGT